MSNLLTRLRARRAETGDKGFTLVELLVVVVIIGILIAIAIPVYLNYTKSAKDKSAQSDLRNAISTIETCSSNGAYPTAVTSAGVMTGCDTQTLKLSTGTTFAFTPTPATGAVTSYMLTAANSGGKPITYCYNSLNGGSVTAAASC